MIFFFLFIILVGYAVYQLASRPKTSVEKEKKEIEKIEFPQNFSWALLVSVLALNIFAYDTSYGIGTSFFNLFLVSAILLTFPKEKRSKAVLLLAAISIFAGMGMGYLANGFVHSVNGVVMFLANVALLFLHSFQEIVWSGLWILKQLWLSIGRFFNQLFLLFRQSQHPELKKKATIATFLKTGIITLFIVVFFSGILSSADPVFAQIIEKFQDEIIGRAFLSLFFAVFLSAVLSMKAKTGTEKDRTELSFFSFQDIIVSLTAVVILFGIFLAVQAQYLFGSHGDLQSFNLTYSEYVRKGFVELLIASFFGMLLSYVVILKKNVIAEESGQRKLSIMNAVFLLELFFMLGSALKRDLMYMEVYGLTRVRMIGGIFLAWLAGLLILVFMLAIWKKMREQYVFSGILVLSAAVVVFLNVVNIDAIVARATPAHHNFKDYFYINSLSEDGFEGWKESVPAAEQAFSVLRTKYSLTDIEKAQLADIKLAMIALQENWENLEKKYGSEEIVISKYFEYSKEIPEYYQPNREWQSYNLSQYNAYQHMSANKDLYETKVASLVDQIKAFQRERNIDLFDQEWRLMRELQYPFVSTDLRYYPDRFEKIAPSPVPSMWPSVSPSPSLIPLQQ